MNAAPQGARSSSPPKASPVKKKGPHRPGEGRNISMTKMMQQRFDQNLPAFHEACRVLDGMGESWENIHDVAVTKDTVRKEKLDSFVAGQKRKQLDLVSTALQKYGKCVVSSDETHMVACIRNANYQERLQKRTKLNAEAKVTLAAKNAEKEASLQDELVTAEEEGRGLASSLEVLKACAAKLRMEIAAEQKLAGDMAHVVPARPITQKM
eukprot:TRINITY_DN2094_c1_g9_i1.p1 TRINITY_DN2094_c1_g9~~TRINITY_DN2094_c1_g9_i1.p1  ORF type:complete len:210 (+),score=70.69 TRINITY_DN2094_c1_g9_i1:51-680(+)